MSEIPRGWMDAETAKAHACRGVWAYKLAESVRLGETVDGMGSRESAAEVLADICDGEQWRYIGPHPDDEPAAGTVEIEAWVVVAVGKHGVCCTAYDERKDADATMQADREMGDLSKVVRLTGRTTPPTPEAVETVRGVCGE